MNTDPRVDVFIEKSADFAKPILTELRSLVHEAHPEIEETWKWSFPTFTYQDKIICSMSAFKNHCSFGFWQASHLPDPHQILERVGKTAMGSLGKISNLTDLPERSILIEYIRFAVELSKKGVDVAKKTISTTTSANRKPVISVLPAVRWGFSTVTAAWAHQFLRPPEAASKPA